MGLDLVELVIETERHFGIEIPDAEAARIRTPGQLAAFVERQLAARGSLAPGPCLTQAAFYRLRRVLVAEWRLPREQVAPAMPLDAALPPRERARHWDGLRRALGSPSYWPELERPRWIRRALGSLAMTSFVALLVAAPAGRAAWPLVGTAVLGAVGAYAIGLRLTSSMRVAVEPPGYTLGNMAAYLSAYLPKPARGPVWTREEVRAQVRAIVSRELGVTNFTDQSDFIRDLNAD